MPLSPAVLTSIYDAAISENAWTPALDIIKTQTSAKTIILYEFPSSNRVEYELNRFSTGSVPLEPLIDEYNRLVASGGGSGYDQEGLGYVHKTASFSVVDDDDIWMIDDAHFERPELAIGRRAGLWRRTFVNLSTDPAAKRGLIFLYGGGASFKPPRDANRLSSKIGPHLAKALELYRFTHGLRTTYRAVLTVLDRLATGILVVSHRGDVIVANRMASELLAAGDGLRCVGGSRLGARNTDADARLLAIIGEVAATAQGDADNSGESVRIPRAGAPDALVAVISPLRDAEMELERGLTGALVTLVDPSRPIDTPMDLVASLYSLTQAERRVAELLLQGMTNSQIAEVIGVSSETIKSQVGAILRKSGCRSRVALIWRIFQVVPPLR